jgi:hypothetical protein
VLHACVVPLESLFPTFVPVSLRLEDLLNLPSHLFSESNHATFVAIQLCQVNCEGWSGKVSATTALSQGDGCPGAAQREEKRP